MFRALTLSVFTSEGFSCCMCRLDLLLSLVRDAKMRFWEHIVSPARELI